MNRIIQITVLCFLAWLSAAPGCKDKKGKTKANPEDAVSVFFTHLNAREFEKAKEIGTNNTREYIDMIESYVMLGGNATPIPFQNVTCDVKGETAVCVYCCNHQKERETVSLVMDKGKWQVDLTKDEASAFNLNKDAIGNGQIPEETKEAGGFE